MMIDDFSPGDFLEKPPLDPRNSFDGRTHGSACSLAGRRSADHESYSTDERQYEGFEHGRDGAGRAFQKALSRNRMKSVNRNG